MPRLKCAIILLISLSLAMTVDRNNFNTCQKSSFCSRHRESQENVYVVENIDTIDLSHGHVVINIKNVLSGVPLKFDLFALSGPMIRFKINEIDPIRSRFEVPNIIQQLPEPVSLKQVSDNKESAIYKFEGEHQIIVTKSPFSVSLFQAGVLLAQFNDFGRLKFEHYVKKMEAPAEDLDEDNEDAEDTAPHEQNDDQDEAPVDDTDKGVASPLDAVGMSEGVKKKPTNEHTGSSVGVDIKFCDFEHVYGIPEHADSFDLKSTKGSEPYRLYNLDVFEYEVWNPMALYGSIPFIMAHSEKRSLGFFWLNAAETWIDIEKSVDKPVFSKIADYVTASDERKYVSSHWISKSGIIDAFFLLGPTTKQINHEFSKLVGFPPLPPLFGLGYHQCRWNYIDENDCLNVDKNFDKHDIPYDVLWLDIEHTDNKMYFTWDATKFPDSKKMLNHFDSKGRKMVTIVDPHIKISSSYYVCQEGLTNDYFVKNADGNGPYKGWCWSGDSHWVDFLNPDARNWWSSLFSHDKYQGSAPNVFTWNDMNEPSVFNGPEVTMPGDLIHHGNIEHQEVHNIYGIHMTMSTFEGLERRSDNNLRGFLLTRAFFAGSQRYGAMWTGDNTADWAHLKVSLPMLLSINIAGFSFGGADVGGFFKDPETELLVRWYQTAAFTPFFRSHAHIHTKRREPYLFDKTTTSLIRDAIRLRYKFLPFWYTLFFEASHTGLPIMRPLFVEFPLQADLFSNEVSYMLGPSLLVAPVLEKGVTTHKVHFPGIRSDCWYDFDDGMKYHSTGYPVNFDVKLSSIPLFIRGGSVIPIKEVIRRSSVLSRNDPVVLIIAPSAEGKAFGTIYQDDEHSFEYKKGVYMYRQFTYENHIIQSSKATVVKDDPINISLQGDQTYNTKSWLQKIIVYDVEKKPKEAQLTYTGSSKPVTLKVEYKFAHRIAVIRKPGVNLQKDFTLEILF